MEKFQGLNEGLSSRAVCGREFSRGKGWKARRTKGSEPASLG